MKRQAELSPESHATLDAALKRQVGRTGNGFEYLRRIHHPFADFHYDKVQTTSIAVKIVVIGNNSRLKQYFFAVAASSLQVRNTFKTKVLDS